MNLHKILFYSLVLILLLPALQRGLNFAVIPPLQGDFTDPSKPKFSAKTWNSGEYQQAYQAFTESRIGFRNILIRLFNQLDYSLFNIAHARGVIAGKEGQLFEKEYIRAYLGGDFIGNTEIEKKLRRFKYVAHKLKEGNTDLVLVFEPGKASFYPELIPDHFYRQYPGKPNNYEIFKLFADSLGIRYIDFNQYFKSLKGTLPWPLYPPTGIHWSEYGMWFAADSLVHYLEHLRSVDLPEMQLDSFSVSMRAKDCDYDAAAALNLMCRLSHPPYAYPHISFPDKPGRRKISVLTVGDSYYWNIFNTGLPEKLFSNQAFWYFNSLVYPDSYFGEKKVETLDVLKEAQNQDVILLMVTERFLSKFDWGFIDQLFARLAPELIDDLPYLYNCKVRQFSDWFDMVAGKAEENGRRLEEQIRLDAMYVLQQEHPDLYLYYTDTTGMRNQQVLLSRDTAAMRKIRQNPWFLREEDMIWQVAIARAANKPHFLALMTW